MFVKRIPSRATLANLQGHPIRRQTGLSGVRRLDYGGGSLTLAARGYCDNQIIMEIAQQRGFIMYKKG